MTEISAVPAYDPLIPPQQAGDLVWQAGLVGRDSQGRPTGWADQDLVYLHARDDRTSCSMTGM